MKQRRANRSSTILQWRSTGPSVYALGGFGAIKGFDELPPWIVLARGRLVGLFRTFGDARAALLEAARRAGYAPAP